MITAGILLIFVIAAVIYAATHKAMVPGPADEYDRPTTKLSIRYVVMVGGLLLGGMIIAAVEPYATEKIDPGFVGLRVSLIGDERGVSKFQYKTGWVFYNTYTEQVVEIPSSQQHVEYEATGIARGGFAVEVAPSFNYEIIPENAGDMYVSLRRTLAEVQETWLKTASVGATNDVINRWSVDSIFNHRAEFEAEVMHEVGIRTQEWFRLSQIRTNIKPPASLQKAIEGKTAAVQEAQEMMAKNQVIEMENLNKIMTARGDSAKAVIDAKGVAEAMRIKKEEVTSLYVEYLKVINWDGKNPSTLVTDGSSTTVMVK